MKTDWHCHILPGLDDGPATIDESIEMARALADAGFTTVHCTPHCIRGMYENSPVRVKKAASELQKAIDDAGIPLLLIPGVEYHLDEYLLDILADPLPLSGNLLLIESSPGCIPQFLTETLGHVINRGFSPLLAHPERCELFSVVAGSRENRLDKYLTYFLTEFLRLTPQSKTDKTKLEQVSLLESLRSMGCLFQGDLGSFAGLYGELVRLNAEFLRNAGLYTHYGTDMHSIRQKEILNVLDTWALP